MPLFNHTREDSALTPCPICKHEMEYRSINERCTPHANGKLELVDENTKARVRVSEKNLGKASIFLDAEQIEGFGEECLRLARRLRGLESDVPSPGTLWRRAGGDHEVYVTLMIKYGHLIKGEEDFADESGRAHGNAENPPKITCPVCSASHQRGYLDPIGKVARCLRCGLIWNTGKTLEEQHIHIEHPPPEHVLQLLNKPVEHGRRVSIPLENLEAASHMRVDSHGFLVLSDSERDRIADIVYLRLIDHLKEAL